MGTTKLLSQKFGHHRQRRVDEIMKLLVPLLIFCWALCASAGVTQREEESPEERGAELELTSERPTPIAAEEALSENKVGLILQDEVEPYSDREAEVSSDGYVASDRLRGWLKKKWKRLKRRLERQYRNNKRKLEIRFRNEKRRLNSRWISRKRSWERRWRNTKRSMERRWANTKRRMETRWRNTKKQIERRWSRIKGQLEYRLRKAKAEVGRWKKSYENLRRRHDEIRRKIRKYAKYADPNYVQRLVIQKAHEYADKHWTRLKGNAEREWIKRKKTIEHKVNEVLKKVKNAIKKLRSVMRQIPYYWKMIKATRQFIRDYKPKPPNRMLGPYEKLNE